MQKIRQLIIGAVAFILRLKTENQELSEPTRSKNSGPLTDEGNPKNDTQDRFQDSGEIYTKPQRDVYKVFIHCSASDNPKHDNIETIRSWHLERGFADVGYHYFIRKDGTLEKGRPLEAIPAAQKGHNSGSIAICLSGLEDFTHAQETTLRTLCRKINNEEITFHGHCEVSNKACPVIDYKAALGLDEKGRMNPKA